MPDLRRAIRWRWEGAAHKVIAQRLGRTPMAVAHQLRKHRAELPSKPQYGANRWAAAAHRAREALAWELAVARSERATAPLLRSWPAGVWS
jgi:hypothetical protein